MAKPAQLTDTQRLIILREYALEVYGRFGTDNSPDARDLNVGQRTPIGSTSAERLSIVAQFATYLASQYRSTTFASATQQVSRLGRAQRNPTPQAPAPALNSFRGVGFRPRPFLRRRLSFVEPAAGATTASTQPTV